MYWEYVFPVYVFHFLKSIFQNTDIVHFNDIQFYLFIFYGSCTLSPI